MTRHPGCTGRILVDVLVDSPGMDVPPGDTYQTVCCPREPLLISEILVRYFTLTELYVGNYSIKTRESRIIGDTRAYHVEPAGIDVSAAVYVRLVLKNSTDQTLRARQANFEEHH